MPLLGLRLAVTVRLIVLNLILKRAKDLRTQILPLNPESTTFFRTP